MKSLWIDRQITSLLAESVRSVLLSVLLVVVWGISGMNSEALAEQRPLVVRMYAVKAEGHPAKRVTETQQWNPKETAIVVCDVWDAHHSINAVRRMNEFLPRLNRMLIAARTEGATIIHSPSDCMPAYESHPARKSAIQALDDFTKKDGAKLPPDITAWISQTKAEREAFMSGVGRYPLDQSDGGEDDDPEERSRWHKKLASDGRNPNLPWQRQSSSIEIKNSDFISDRGDEVWSILQNKQIKLVILTGVHTNMCVLGRPFGLRQMVNNGMRTLLVRDLTDCMYNPQRWPFVDHFTGNDLLISHVERFVCPTTTSEQILGGTMPFVFSGDKRMERDIDQLPAKATSAKRNAATDWSVKPVPTIEPLLPPLPGGKADVRIVWYRCNLRLMTRHLGNKPDLKLVLRGPMLDSTVWLNGEELESPELNNDGWPELTIPSAAVTWDDANLLVIRLSPKARLMGKSPLLVVAEKEPIELSGLWQVRVGEVGLMSNIPLPAKFGTSPEIVIEPGSDR